MGRWRRLNRDQTENQQTGVHVVLEVVATPMAQQQILGLRGRRRNAYEEFERELALKGCAVLGYRLTGDAPLPSLCVRHLIGADRVVVAFRGGRAWVLLVGPHEAENEARDVYSSLYDLLGLQPPTGHRTKPPCCDPRDGRPPAFDDAVLDDLVRRSRALLRRGRR